MRSRVAGSLALTVALAAGCTTGADALFGSVQVEEIAEPVETEPPIEERGGTSRDLDEGVLRVEDRGEEPRQLLSLAPQGGTVQRLTVTQTGRQTFSLEGESTGFEFPVLAVDVELSVIGFDPDSDLIEVEAVVTAVDLADELGSSVAAAELLSADGADSLDSDQVMVGESASVLSGLDGVTVRLRTDTNGRIVGEEPTLGDGVSYEALVMGYFERNIFTLADPLPDRELGVGASWTYVSTGLTEGIPATVTRRYTIVEITDQLIRATVARRVDYEAGTYLDTTVLSGSEMTGSGEVIWPRNGILGGARYDLAGEIEYRLGEAVLVQSVEREVDSSFEMLHVPPTPEPTAVENSDPADAEPDDADPDGESGSENPNPPGQAQPPIASPSPTPDAGGDDAGDGSGDDPASEAGSGGSGDGVSDGASGDGADSPDPTPEASGSQSSGSEASGSEASGSESSGSESSGSEASGSESSGSDELSGEGADSPETSTPAPGVTPEAISQPVPAPPAATVGATPDS